MVCLKRERRLEVIREGLLNGLNHDDIAERCGCSRVTIKRDLREWRASGDYEAWLLAEWFRLHGRMRRENVKAAYVNVTKLLEKFMRQRIDLDVNTPKPIIIRTWRPENE